ncbi:hypothetical protein BK674_18005 [Pseudomonas moraviensis]|uniref:Uncharacterized protein n=1 Tax=Pseudomonas moraviensis TaxID=321662 RepID=A0A423NM44_9PSED|nr:hypothetical protein [Pseudomonas moraviensis]RON99334.1 hypothetical protein BK674_18005 [Pseudomonas moraviensis]
MSLTKLEQQEMRQITAMLSSRIELNKDLPEMVFRDSGLEFYFFERPLLSNVDVLDDLLCSSFKVFSTRAFALFSAPLANICYLFDGENIQKGVEELSVGFRDFFKGTVNYPVIMGNVSFDWLLFESAYEEYGVLALDSQQASNEFSEFLSCNLISSPVFQSLKGHDKALDKIIAAFHTYFERI